MFLNNNQNSQPMSKRITIQQYLIDNQVINQFSNLAFITGSYDVNTGAMTGNLHVMAGGYTVTPVTGSVSN